MHWGWHKCNGICNNSKRTRTCHAKQWPSPPSTKSIYYIIPVKIWSHTIFGVLVPFSFSGKRTFYSTCRKCIEKRATIKLTMRKDRSSKIKTNILDRLTLRLVDGHCKSKWTGNWQHEKRDVQSRHQMALLKSLGWRWSFHLHPRSCIPTHVNWSWARCVCHCKDH